MPAKSYPASGVKRLNRPPHPYVIEPPEDQKTDYKRGDTLTFTLLLFGEANNNLAYFIYAFDQIGDIGIGKRVDGKLASFCLHQVSAGRHIIYSKEESKIRKDQPVQNLSIELPKHDGDVVSDLTVELITPLRLKYENSLHAELPFHVLIRAMLRRASSLFEYHGGGEPPLDYRGLILQARDINIKESRISWHDWRRYSNRQEQAMMMGGMIGEITYANVPGEYMPLLRFCEQVHLGKQTTFGLGKIKVIQK